jgi:hypothetical protein
MACALSYLSVNSGSGLFSRRQAVAYS